MKGIRGFYSNNKAIIIIIIIIIAISILISIICFASYKNIKAKNNYNERLVEVESLIQEGEYTKAIEKIKEINETIKGLDRKYLMYQEVLENYLLINFEKDKFQAKEELNDFYEKYEEELKKTVFYRLYNEVVKQTEELESYFREVIEAKKVIEDNISGDIDKAKVLIDEFKSKYPLEDITELESKYKERVEYIEKEKEEKSVVEEIDYEKDINNSGATEGSGKGIGSTLAAQNSSQIITVVSNGGSYGELVMWEKDGSDNWIEVDRVAARLGQNGMKYESEVYEMDKCTPTGIYTVTEAFGINGNPGSGVPYRELDGSEYWVDDVDSEYYNTMQFGEPNGRWASAEKLTDFGGYYNYALVIDYNRWPVISGKSSAIFLHCDMGIYTYGCVAIPQNNLVNLLTWLNPSNNPVIILDFTYEDIYTNY